MAALISQRAKYREQKAQDVNESEDLNSILNDLDLDLDGENGFKLDEKPDDDSISLGTTGAEDVSEFQFEKFAATYFIAAGHSFIRKQLRQPLLHHEEETDVGAALAVWLTILRFMGDVADSRDHGDYSRRKVGTVGKKQ